MPGRLVGYGHSWVVGDGVTRPQRRLLDVAASRLGLTPVDLASVGRRAPRPPSWSAGQATKRDDHVAAPSAANVTASIVNPRCWSTGMV